MRTALLVACLPDHGARAHRCSIDDLPATRTLEVVLVGAR